MALNIRAFHKNKKGDEEIQIQDDLLVVHERDELTIAVQCGDGVQPRATLGPRSLPWNARARRFDIDRNMLGQWVGGLDLVIQAGDEECSLWLEVAPRPEKARPHEWRAMVHQLERWLGGVTVGQEAGGAGSIGQRGVDARFLAEAMEPVAAEFVTAVREVTQLPVTGKHEQWQLAELHTVRRGDRGVVRQLCRHPDLAAWLKTGQRGSKEPLVLQHRTRPTVEHASNRYVNWLVNQVIARLRQTVASLHDLIKYYNKNSINHTSGWCQARVARIEQHCGDLERLQRGSFLGRLTPRDADRSALAVLIDHPAYARSHQLGRLILSPRFRLDDDATRPDDRAAPVRSSFHLYELWTFFYVYQCLARRLVEPAWRWRPGDLDCLLELTEEGTGAHFTATGPDGAVLQIRFNEEFKRLESKEFVTWSGAGETAGTACFSLAPIQRPDLVICHSRPGQPGRWLCLDAKYYSPKNLGDPMKAIHRYRSSLWMTGYGGRCQAGVLLVPSPPSGYRELWAREAFLEKFDVGVRVCTPGAAPDHDFADWMLGRLGITPSA